MREQEKPRPRWEHPGFLADAVEKGLDREFVNRASAFGKFIREAQAGSSPLRTFLGRLMKIEIAGEDGLAEAVPMLKPELACACALPSGGIPRAVRDVLDRAIDRVLAAGDPPAQAERFRRLCRGFEAILAYHRVYGGG